MNNHLLPLAAVPAVMLLLTGCEQVSWLQPLYDDQVDVVQEPGLAGTWQETGKDPGKDADTFLIRPDGDHYVIEMRDGSKNTSLEARLVRFGGQTYFDVLESGPGIPAHQFWKVALSGDQLELAILADDFVLDKLKKENALPHERMREGQKDTRYVITAQPWEVRNFLLRYDTGLWENRTTCRRVSAVH